jgi:hypothetical protein
MEISQHLLPHSTLAHHPLLPLDPVALVDATATSNVLQIQTLTIMYFPKQHLHVMFFQLLHP